MLRKPEMWMNAEVLPSRRRGSLATLPLPSHSRVLTGSLRFASGNQAVELVAEARFDTHASCDLLARVDDGGVISPSEETADFRQRELGELAEQVHRDLSRKRHRTSPPATAEGLGTYSESFGDHGDDPFGTDVVGLRIDVVAEHLFDEIGGDLLMEQGAECEDPDQASLEVTNVVANAVGEQEQEIGRNLRPLAFFATTFVQNREPRLEIRLLDVGHEPLIEA